MKRTRKQALSTGDMAEYIGVGHRTVLRWVKDGLIEAFHLPGRGDTRIPVEECVKFMLKHGMPIPPELREFDRPPVVMVIEEEPEVTRSLESDTRLPTCHVCRVDSPFEAVFEAAKNPPAVMVVVADGNDDQSVTIAGIESAVPGLRAGAVVGTRNGTFDDLPLKIKTLLRECSQ